ncbi:MAG: class I SAM-dependent methyltransferase [Acidobacteriia bacterium]|nr:class I SAM-dependent methyltransferase [Terriglobia bacterium]
MTGVRRMLSRIKFRLLAPVRQRAYWNLMALYDPVHAVCSEAEDERDLYESGTVQVSMMKDLGLLGRDKDALHIGCGIGRIELNIAGHVHFALGIDVSERMVKIARRKVQAENVGFALGSGRDLSPLRDHSFDLCYSFIAFQHMPRPVVANYFQQVTKKLKPGGRLFFQIPIDETGSRREPPPDHPYGLRYYSSREVSRLLEQAGLRLLGRYDDKGERFSGSGDGSDAQYFLAGV